MTKKLLILTMALMMMASCHNQAKQPADEYIGKADVTLSSDLMTPEVLWKMGRLSDVQVSPDGKKAVYGVSYYSVEKNASNRELYLLDIATGTSKALTHTAKAEYQATWSKDGSKIYYLSSKDGKMQLWNMQADGSQARCLTAYEGGIDAYAFSPDESKLLFVSQVPNGPTTAELYPDLPLSSGLVINDLMYKHWDEWQTSIPHPFVADFNKGKLANVRDLLEGTLYESPMKPFGGIEQLAWSPDGKTVAYTCRKKTGMAYSLSTNSDIFLYHLADGSCDNLTEGMMGYDTNPVYSPSGRYIAFSSMEREGYESDKNRLMVYDSQSGEIRDYTADFDQEASSLAWSADEQYIYFVSVWHARTHVYELQLSDGKIRQITRGDYDFENALPADGCLLATRHSLSHPNEVVRVDIASGEMQVLTHENDHIFNQLTVGRVEERWIRTTDNKDMLTWVVYPPHFDPNKQYPTLLYCQGGPQSAVSQFWSFRWNLQLMAAQGYIVVAPNRHGLPGFGQEWLEQISGDYGGQNMQDYLTAIDAVSKEPYVDSEHLGCVGASYGGFSVYWLAGHHNKRFKAFIAHSGIFNIQQQYLETEELWFANWDIGGPYWDTKNAVAQRTYATSPHLFVDKWDTPILCIHGEKDYRILASQGMSAFNAAKLRGIDAQLLVFPDENHWITKPQNAILWQRTFFGWLDKYLK